MMLATPVIERLKPLAIFKSFGGLLEYAAHSSAPPRALPAAFVVTSGDKAEANRLAGGHDQKVSEDWAVIFVLPGALRQDNKASEELEEIRWRVAHQLIGWRPDPSYGLAEYIGGDLLSANASLCVWRLRFRSTYHLRKV